MALKWRGGVRDPRGSENHAVPAVQTGLAPGSTVHKRRSNAKVAAVVKVAASQVRLLMARSDSIWMFLPLVSAAVSAVPGG